MLDFLRISTRSTKRGVTEIYPKFVVGGRSEDLMIRGGDFYAIWNSDTELWSTDEDVVIKLIDRELDRYKAEQEPHGIVLYMWDSESGMIDKWHKYCQKQQRDNFHQLDEKLIFSNTKTTKKDYASKRLPYALSDAETPAYNELMSTLYSEEERKKIEWAIGSIVSGDSVNIQKFLVMYGSAGTGKSTVLNIIQKLFEGYYSVFDAKALGSANNSFALEAFKSNPLVAIQHDGDLSRIEDNTRLNSVVSHELMTVNEKFKSTYASRFKCFLFMGTNKPVRITDAKSGIIRRLIDVSPTGNKIRPSRYRELVKQIDFELGGIASHCLEVYSTDPQAYDNYIPVAMLGASNDFYNFVLDSYDDFASRDGVTLKSAWSDYNKYCDEAKVVYRMPQRAFKEELKNYFREFSERATVEDGTRVRNYYSGFLTNKFEVTPDEDVKSPSRPFAIDKEQSIFDLVCAECPAQYGTLEGTPLYRWDNVVTKLKDIDTRALHYVRVPENHIVIDFDLKDENGEKSYERNIEAASKWPKTYAELSKSGKGIHLHYIYTGDVNQLSRIYEPDIEVKVFTGHSSLRRKLSKCNDIPIATISSGLPLKGYKQVITNDTIKSERSLRTLLLRNLQKEIHPNTKPSIDFIKKILDDVYASGLKYDVSDLRPDILSFALHSTHNAKYCSDQVALMHFKSDEPSDNKEDLSLLKDSLIFFDTEVYPNLFVLAWKAAGEESSPVAVQNPSPEYIEEFVKHRLVGFNCRKYDNHILYARIMGYNNEQLFELSQRIIANSPNAYFGEAYNVSYTDVYDFSSEKKSLKKFEIDLGIHHMEMGIPWDQPVPECLWNLVGEYCANDVLATEAVFNARKGDWLAREILADVAGMTVNDTTNSLTTRIIFGTEKKPDLVYTDLATGERTDGTRDSISYPGYSYEFLEDNRPHNIYRGEDVGFGGYVYAQPGIWHNVTTFDVNSMHPASIIALNCFGEYTRRFQELRDARIAIKHKDFEKAKQMLDGKLAKYLDDPASAKSLAQALKIAINSVYGLTSASFNNAFRDIRNKNNIVALRGALFMVDLKYAIQEKGFQVVHIKTDSIKVVDATPELSAFILDFGKRYGYTFEIESHYERMCLVNDAVYVAKGAEDDPEHPNQWTATGTQFAVPYVFKTLFSHEPIIFSDLCETKSVTTAMYLDENENLQEGEHSYRFVGKVGSFCPIRPGHGGGELLREQNGKYNAVVGTKGYRWLEAESVLFDHKEDDIDRKYYDNLVDKAIETISKFGDFEQFTA